MEEERLAKAFNIKQEQTVDKQKVEGAQPSTVPNVEQISIKRLLDEVAQDIDDGKKGVAKSKIESFKKWLRTTNYFVNPSELKILNNFSDMVK